MPLLLGISFFQQQSYSEKTYQLESYCSNGQCIVVYLHSPTARRRVTLSTTQCVSSENIRMNCHNNMLQKVLYDTAICSNHLSGIWSVNLFTLVREGNTQASKPFAVEAPTARRRSNNSLTMFVV